MNDLEQDLRELLEGKAREAGLAPEPGPRVLKRARRRQIGTVLAATLTTAAVVVGAIAGLQAALRGPQLSIAVAPIGEGLREAVLPYGTIAYPVDWYLVDASAGLSPGETGPVLQLTNYDPGVDAVRCIDGTIQVHSTDALLLRVSIGTETPYEDAAPAPPWPVELAVPPEPGAFLGVCTETDEKLFAKWTTDAGVVYTARALIGRDASPEDRRALLDAFASLAFPADDRPQTENLLGSPAVVLDAAGTPIGPVVLYAYVAADEDPHLAGPWIGVAGPAGSGIVGAGQVGGEVPSGDESVTIILDVDGGIVWGDVSETAVRAEFRTVEGETYPATLVALPASLGAEGHQGVWGFVDPTSGRVTTVLYDAQGNVLNDTYPTGPRETIATGVDPVGGPWELYITHESIGDGLGFEFVEHGGGAGCCLQPLRQGEDLQLEGWSSGGGAAQNVIGFASTRVARVAIVSDDGQIFEAQLFAFPEKYIGPVRVWLALVLSVVDLSGDAVAYDSDGNELDRKPVGEVSGPSGPTPEIDEVWQALYLARDALDSEYLREHGTLSDLSAIAMVELAPDVAFNDSPTAVPGEVSVRGAGRFEVVFASTTARAEVYCIGIETDEQDAFTYHYGRVDAQTQEECRGGWDAGGE